MTNKINTWNICSSGMNAQWKRLHVISRNLSNAENTRTQEGGPYRKQYVVFSAALDDMKGVNVNGTTSSNEPFRTVYNPGHPDADESGHVQMPNVKMPVETIHMMSAVRAYRANFMAMENYRKICRKTIELMES